MGITTPPSPLRCCSTGLSANVPLQCSNYAKIVNKCNIIQNNDANRSQGMGWKVQQSPPQAVSPTRENGKSINK